MRIIPNLSEKRFVSRLMKNGQKPIRPNPINSETNPNESEPIRKQVFNPGRNWTQVEVLHIFTQRLKHLSQCPVSEKIY